MTEKKQDRVDVSVIIPTYNRKDSLLRTLDSLARQTYPTDRFEVIVVDDGGSDGTEEALAQRQFPFALRYIRQQNQGDARARNRGAQEAQGEILQFLDDDIILDSNFLMAITEEHQRDHRLMVIGRLLPMTSDSPTVFEQVAAAQAVGEHSSDSGNGYGRMSTELPFTDILSGILSLKREHYLALGMMQPVVESGSSVWCDVEFAHRAKREGFVLHQRMDAEAVHDDYALRSLQVACRRAYRAGAAGPELLQRHPELRTYLPSLQDKDPVAWRQDSLSLVARKLARQVASSLPVMWIMESFVVLVERQAPTSRLLALLYRWILSGHIYRGYREALRLLGRG